MVGNLPLTLTSASNVEVIAKSEYYDEAEVLAELGRMEFEILPTECTDKNKKAKPMPKFEIKDPKMENWKFEPQYKYGSELNNSTNPEVVFKKVLDQPVTLKLSEILGSSFKLG